MVYKGVYLHNVVEMLEEEGGAVPIRIPDSLRMSVNPGVQSMALQGAGVEIRFNLKSKEARIVLMSKEEGAFVGEIYQGNFLVGTYVTGNRETEIIVSLPAKIEKLRELSQKERMPFDAGLTRVILPYRATCVIKEIEGEFELPEKEQLPTKRYLAYGSSITHGSSATRPTGTYAMRTAQLLGVDLLNLGFGGSAHCEKEMADYIAGRDDWDLASLEMGINMIGGFDITEFRKRVEYFVPRIAQAHPDTHIFCIDMFTFYLGLKGEREKQKAFRDVVRDVAIRLKSEKVIHIDGRKLLKNWAGLCTDLVHPSPSGMEEIAKNLSGVIKKYIKQ
ncbi:MAG: SGNH/GDSL hydrolase family protein, partial [Candidatus Ratteibacteria bacterium]|nr:SGNH/GDSL hydrolase family protein [Candidatus Ratteibacteria bacterium]